MGVTNLADAGCQRRFLPDFFLAFSTSAWSASGEVTLAPDGENLSSAQLAAVVSNSTLARLRRRYAVLLKTPVLALSETHHHCEENRTRKVPF